MSTYPKAELKLIKPGVNDPRIIPVGMVLHIAVSKSNSLFNWFNGPSGGIECHVYVRTDGTVEQYRDFDFEADAQSAGNSWIVNGKRFGLLSVETEGMGPGVWSPQQVATIVELIKWCSTRYGFPIQKITSSQPAVLSQGGIGWHSQYSSWNPKQHSCPGPDRITQIPAIIAAAGAVTPKPTPTPAPAPTPTPVPDKLDPVVKALIVQLLNTDSVLSRALRNNIRLAVQAELKDQAEGKNP